MNTRDELLNPFKWVMLGVMVFNISITTAGTIETNAHATLETLNVERMDINGNWVEVAFDGANFTSIFSETLTYDGPNATVDSSVTCTEINALSISNQYITPNSYATDNAGRPIPSSLVTEEEMGIRECHDSIVIKILEPMPDSTQLKVTLSYDYNVQYTNDNSNEFIFEAILDIPILGVSMSNSDFKQENSFSASGKIIVNRKYNSGSVTIPTDLLYKIKSKLRVKNPFFSILSFL